MADTANWYRRQPLSNNQHSLPHQLPIHSYQEALPRDILFDIGMKDKVLAASRTKDYLDFDGAWIEFYQDLTARTLQHCKDLKPITLSHQKAGIRYLWASFFKLHSQRHHLPGHWPWQRATDAAKTEKRNHKRLHSITPIGSHSGICNHATDHNCAYQITIGVTFTS